jgi:hypothetical protein
MKTKLFLLALCLLPSIGHGELWRFTASGTVDGIGNTSTNPAPAGIVLGQSAFAECVYESSAKQLGTSSNTYYTNSILYTRVTIGAYTWRYIGRADGKVSCSDNDSFTKDQLIFAGNGYSTGTFPLAHGGHWQVTPLRANDQDGSNDMLTSAYIADLPNSFNPALAVDVIGWVRSAIPTDPHWYIRYTISPGSISFQPMAKPAPNQLAYSNTTFSMYVSNMVPGLTYFLEGVAEMGDTNWQPVFTFPAAESLDPELISVDVGGDKYFYRIRGQ